MLGQRFTIAANGRVRASVAAREIEVRGCFIGQAEASELIRLGPGAEFVGDIWAARTVIEDGAFINGKVELSSLRLLSARRIASGVLLRAITKQQ